MSVFSRAIISPLIYIALLTLSSIVHAQDVEEQGFVDVSEGPIVSPSVVQVDEEFRIDFSLTETEGRWKELSSIEVWIQDLNKEDEYQAAYLPGPHLFESGTTYEYSVTTDLQSSQGRRAGDYQVTIRATLKNEFDDAIDVFPLGNIENGRNPSRFNAISRQGFVDLASANVIFSQDEYLFSDGSGNNNVVVVGQPFEFEFKLQEFEGVESEYEYVQVWLTHEDSPNDKLYMLWDYGYQKFEAGGSIDFKNIATIPKDSDLDGKYQIRVFGKRRYEDEPFRFSYSGRFNPFINLTTAEKGLVKLSEPISVEVDTVQSDRAAEILADIDFRYRLKEMEGKYKTFEGIRYVWTSPDGNTSYGTTTSKFSTDFDPYEVDGGSISSRATQAGTHIFSVEFKLPGDDWKLFEGAENPVRFEVPARKRRYVALGDSYSSGDGVVPYVEGTNNGGTIPFVNLFSGNDCRRSTRAYPNQLIEFEDLRSQFDLSFHACQGAVTADFLVPRDNREDSDYPWSELPQEDYILPDTGLITLSIGGNDAEFVYILKECIKGAELSPFNTCWTDSKVTDLVEKRFSILDGDVYTDGVVPYKILFDRIISKKPKLATVVVVGYPPLFNPDGGKNKGTCAQTLNLASQDRNWMAKQTVKLNDIIEKHSIDAGFLFVDPTEQFKDNYLCDDSEEEWFFSIGIINKGQAHPTIEGHTAIAELIHDKLVSDSTKRDYINPNETIRFFASVDEDLSSVVFSNAWPGSDIVMTLTSPSGQQISRYSQSDYVNYSGGPTFERFEVMNPEPGDWAIELFGLDVDEDGEEFLFLSSAVPKESIYPVADFTYTLSKSQLELNSALSFDQDGEIQDQLWYVISDGVEYEYSGENVTHDIENNTDISVTLVVTDEDGLFDFKNTIIDISTSENSPPYILPLDEIDTVVGASITHVVRPTDPDGDVPNLFAEVLPEGASLSDNFDGTRTFSWVPTEKYIGQNDIVLVTTDSQNSLLSSKTILTVNVRPYELAENSPPSIQVLENQNVAIGETLRYNIVPDDPDGDVPWMYITNLPENALFYDEGNGTRTFSWQPNESDLGSKTLNVVLRDARDTNIIVNYSFTVDISNKYVGNTPPRMELQQLWSVKSGQSLSFLVAPTDDDGSVPGVFMKDHPRLATLEDNLDGTRTFLWSPENSDIGVHNFVFVATDADTPSLIYENNIQIVVEPMDDLHEVDVPLAHISDRTIRIGETLHLVISASQDGSETQKLNAKIAPEGYKILNNGNGSQSFEWVADRVGDTTVVLSTENQLGRVGNYEESFNITVTD